MMVSVDIGSTRFTYRVGAIAIDDGRVMLNRGVGEPYWFIPGGRVEIGEDSESALLREMREEIGQDVLSPELACVIENFFSERGKAFHEIGIYYSVRVPKPWEGTLRITDGGGELEYEWMSLSRLEGITLYPAAIKEFILGRATGKHFINDERK